MKAKEIAAEILKIAGHGAPANEAFTKLFVQDFQSMQQANRDRKGGDAALLRLMKEHNQKWNSVIKIINQDELFKKDGVNWLHQDDFVRMTLAMTGDENDDSQIQMILSPFQVSNESVARIRRHIEEQKVNRDLFLNLLGFGR
jgi:hypothetical protein